jgi:D-sedoheptulose 7-phosphate isomerase
MTTKIKTAHAYLQGLITAAQEIDSDKVDQVATELLATYFRDRTIFVFGNGGSAATASHFACDVAKGATKWLHQSARRFRVVALTDNVPLLTAWANDSHYEEVFAEQLRNFVRHDDLVIAISGSGNSRNVVNALKVAQSAGARTVGLTGCMGGTMISLCRQFIIVPSHDMEIIEDLHLAVCHSLASMVRTALEEFHRDAIQSPVLNPAHIPAAVCSDSGTSGGAVLRMTAAPVILGEFNKKPKPTRGVKAQMDAD